MDRIAVIGDLQRPRPGGINGSTAAAVGWVEALRETRPATVCDLFAPTLSPSHRGTEESLAPADALHILPLASLAERLGMYTYDVLHDVRFGHQLSALSWLATTYSRRPVPVVSAVHYALNFPAAIIGAMQTLISGARECDGLICLSAASAAAQQSLFDDVEQQLRAIGVPTRKSPTLYRIPFGIDLAHFRPVTSPKEKLMARRHLRLPPKATIVVQVARLVGFDKADWEACVRLGQQLADSNSTLVLAGSNPVGFAEHLNTLIRKRGMTRSIMVMPDVADMALLYRAADIGLLLSNSFQETQGLCVLEAMASGLPVVASDWDGIRDNIRDGLTGWLIPTRAGAFRSRLWIDYLLGDARASSLAGCELTSIDFACLTRTLKAVIGNPELRLAASREARRYAEANFGIKTMMSRYSAAWAQMRECLGSDQVSAKRPVTVDWGPLFSQAYASNGVIAGNSLLSVDASLLPLMCELGVPERLRVAGDRLGRALRAVDGRTVTGDELIERLRDGLERSYEDACALVMWLVSYSVATPVSGAGAESGLQSGAS